MTTTVFLKEVSVKNYRSILDGTLICDDLTALVGANGSGKSSFLNAIQLFYNPTAKVTREDFFNNDTNQDIEIALTFTCLGPAAQAHFAHYLDGETLTVTRVLPAPDSARKPTYHGSRFQNPDFAEIRNTTPAIPKREKYKELRKTDRYKDLPAASTAEAVNAAIDDWESGNPDSCQRLLDDGQFFGYRQVGNSYLTRYTHHIHVPAVREASDDATEQKGSTVTELMDLVVRRALTNRPEVEAFKNRMLVEYKDVMVPEQFRELGTLQTDLSKTLQSYVPEAAVQLQWAELSELSIPMPRAEVKLLEDNYASRVGAAGHGVQRALVISLLQHLNTVRSSTEAEAASSDSQLPNLVLTIEEPELYQHPSRQRHFAEVLIKTATGIEPMLGGSTQVIYTTHSPLFIGLDRFNHIRVLRKSSQIDSEPKVTTLKKADMDSVANELQAAQLDPTSEFTAETLRARLQAIMTPWINEGFFADVVVLVEGETDLAAITGVARSMGYELDSLGVAVIPCNGKTCLDRPLVIFRQLDVPVYLVWDGDCNRPKAKAEDNRYILRLLQLAEEDWPEFVGDAGACFKVKLEQTLAGEIGEQEFERLCSAAQKHFGISEKDRALKNPAVIQRIMEEANANGRSSTSLTSVVERIVALRQQTDSAS